MRGSYIETQLFSISTLAPHLREESLLLQLSNDAAIEKVLWPRVPRFRIGRRQLLQNGFNRSSRWSWDFFDVGHVIIVGRIQGRAVLDLRILGDDL